MSLAVFLTLAAAVVAALLASAPAGRFLADHLRPALATGLLALTAVTLAVCGLAALALIVVVGISRWDPVGVEAHWSVADIVGGEPMIPIAAIAATIAAAALSASTLHLARTLRRVALQIRAARALIPDGQPRGSVIEVPETAVAARAVPVRGGHILVATPGWSQLSPREREIVLAHERAHIRRRHHLFLAAGVLAAAANPLLRPLSRSLAYAVERWADEDAAAVIGNRLEVARTVGQLALAGAGSPALGVRGGVVSRRVAALLSTGARPGLSNRGVSVALLLLALAAIATGMVTHAMVDLAEILATVPGHD